MIEVRNLTKSYNVLEKPVVKNVSLCARPGEITILVRTEWGWEIYYD